MPLPFRRRAVRSSLPPLAWLSARLDARLDALLLVGLLALGVGPASAEPWPELPMLPDARIASVADDLEFNGLPMRIVRFRSPRPRDAVAAETAAQWQRGYRTPPHRLAQRDALLVTQVHGPYLMTMKVGYARDGAGSVGLIAVSRPLGARVARPHVETEIPLPPGARVQSVVVSRDAGRRSRQLAASVPGTTAATARYLDAALAARGWHRLHGLSATHGRFGTWQRPGAELSVALGDGPQGAGTAMLVQLTSDGARR